MISQTRTTPGDPARGAVVAGLTGAVFLGTSLTVQVWRTYDQSRDTFGFGFIAVIISPLLGGIVGAVIGMLIGALAGHISCFIRQRKIGLLVSIVVGALIGVLAVLILINSIHPPGSPWTIPAYLLLLGGMLPGILGGIAGNQPQTITSSVCAACGGPVRSDAAFCKHCKAPFE
jgi:hypothetical protein